MMRYHAAGPPRSGRRGRSTKRIKMDPGPHRTGKNSAGLRNINFVIASRGKAQLHMKAWWQRSSEKLPWVAAGDAQAYASG